MIETRDKLISVVRRAKHDRKTVGYTSGAFDILHAGHLEYLSAARDQCDLLIVGVNTDASVQSYKAPGRPVVDEYSRVSLVAGLGCVDYAFLFDEKNNNKNIEELKPDIYFKGGDYRPEFLSSKAFVDSYGGKIVIIPFKEGFSTTSVIKKIEDLSRIAEPSTDNSPPEKAPALFFDRDGTLIKLIDYLDEPEKVELLSGAVEGLRKFRNAGYRLIMVTNQPGIGMGYFSKQDFYRVTLKILKLVSAQGLLIDKIYYCEDTKASGGRFRKPSPGMLERAALEVNISIPESIIVGDSTADIECGNRVGCKTALVMTGKRGEDGLYDVVPDFTASTIEALADMILP